MKDLLIIGSGAAGLTAAIYAKRAGLDVIVAEKEYLGTGQIAQTMRVDNYPGMPGISGFDLGEAFRSHAEALKTEFCEGEALSLKRRETAWAVSLDTGTILEAKAVIVATGCRYRTLNIPGEEELLGKKIHFCALCDGSFYEGKTVAVIGGSQMAATDALYLCTVAKKVLIVYRGSTLRAAQAEINELEKQENIEILYGAAPFSFSEQNMVPLPDHPATKKRLTDNPDSSSSRCAVPDPDFHTAENSTAETGVCLRTADGRSIYADGIFEAIGMIPETEFLKDLLPLTEGGFIPCDETGVTGVPGLFAAGDIRAKPLRQVITACADGANAALSAERYIKSLTKC